MLHYGLFTWRGNFYHNFWCFGYHPHNIECFKNFFPFSSIPFTISRAQLKDAGYKKIITFHLGNYLNIWVTFDVFTWNRMIKKKIYLEAWSNPDALVFKVVRGIFDIAICCFAWFSCLVYLLKFYRFWKTEFPHTVFIVW